MKGMLRRMSPQQFRSWQVYDELEPFDEIRADVRTARIEAALWNIARDTKKHPQPFEVKDFLPDYAGDRRSGKKQTLEEQKNVLMFIGKTLGAKVD